MGKIQERLNVQRQFCGLLPEKFKGVTLIGDASDFPLNTVESDEYSGENSMWSCKLQTTGIYLNLIIIQLRFPFSFCYMICYFSIF
jgi:hypothetical protein